MQAQAAWSVSPATRSCYRIGRNDAVLDASRRGPQALWCQSMSRRTVSGGAGSRPEPGGILSSLRDLIILLAAGGLTWAEKGDGRD